VRGIADARIEEALLRRLGEGPADVVDLVACARTAAPGPLAGREGAFHAILLRLQREGAIVSEGTGPSGGTRYALRGVPVAPAPVPAVPPGVSPSASRAALHAARPVRDPGDRGRIVADVLAHRCALEAEGRLREFGAVKPLAHLLRRADRGRRFIAVAETPWESVKRWALHEGPSVLVTIVGIALVWLFVAEFRVVPSHSMQPTLKPGDRVLVRKAFGQRLPDRWDLVVFKKPSDGTVLVKRVAGLPGEAIAIREGDLVVDGRIAVKPEAFREGVREPLVRQRFDVASPPEGWSVGQGGGVARYAKALFADEPIHGREVVMPPRPTVHDVYVEAAIGGVAGVRIEFADERGQPVNAASGVAWSRDAAGREVVGMLGRDGTLAVLAEGRSAPGSDLVVTLAIVDGRLRFWGSDWVHASEVDLPYGRAIVGVEGDVRSVAIDRDLHYTHHGVYAVDPATPYRVPEAHVFCLGDHSAHSGDSRVREVGPVPLDHLIGPVVFRVWPPWRVGLPR
jgi:signal peptidase I